MIPLPTRAGRWQMAWQGPRLGFLAETGRFCCYGDALSTIFLLVAFVRCFLLFVFRFSFLSFLIFFLHPGRFIFVSLRLCSSHLLRTLSRYVFYSTFYFCLWHLYPSPSRKFFCLFVLYFFRSSYFSGGVFFLLCSRTRYAST